MESTVWKENEGIDCVQSDVRALGIVRDWKAMALGAGGGLRYSRRGGGVLWLRRGRKRKTWLDIACKRQIKRD